MGGIKSTGARKWIIFAATATANLVAAFSINSINLALPTLAVDFGVTRQDVSWLAILYSMIACCTLLIMGRVAELFGYRRQLMIGFLFFGGISLLAPLLSNSLGTLLVFRCVQGLAYSTIASITQAIVSRSFDISERGKALGFNAVFVSVGLAAGPTIGGMLITNFSWRAIFYFNVPVCILGFIATRLVMPADKPYAGGLKKMDAVGALLFAGSVGAFSVGLNMSGEWGFASAPFLGCMAGSVLGITLFILYEKNKASPLMDLRLFYDKTFTLANSACLLSYMVQQMITYLLPFYLVGLLMLPSDRSGLIMMTSPLLMMLVSPFGGHLCDRKGSRLPAGIGLVLICIGCFFMSMLGEATTTWMIVAVLVLVGGGNGMSVSAINTAILNAAASKHAGVASGMVATMRTLGQTLGMVSGSVMLASRQLAYSGQPENQAYLLAQRDTYYFGIAIVIMALVLVLLLPEKRKGPEQETRA